MIQTRHVHIVWATKHGKHRIFGVYTSYAKASRTFQFIEDKMFEMWSNATVSREKLE